VNVLLLQLRVMSKIKEKVMTEVLAAAIMADSEEADSVEVLAPLRKMVVLATILVTKVILEAVEVDVVVAEVVDAVVKIDLTGKVEVTEVA